MPTINILPSKELFVVDELSEKSLIKPDDDKSQLNSTRKRKQIEREQHSRIEGLLQNCQVPVNLEIKEQHVFGKRGYTIAHYAKAKRADLLVVNSPDTKLRFLDRIFKHDLEYILVDLPSDVLIVHTTKDTSYAKASAIEMGKATNDTTNPALRSACQFSLNPLNPLLGLCI